MKTLLASLLIAAVAVTSVEAASEVFVEQIGINALPLPANTMVSIADVGTWAADATAKLGTARTQFAHPDASAAILVQDGIGQHAAFDQAGPGNLGLILQTGMLNSAGVSQVGSLNTALVVQQGYGNVATVSQNGSNHAALVTQQGQGNVAIISQR